MHRPLPPPWDRFVPFAKRLFVWGLFFTVLWILRQFFFLVFLTFVFGYIQAHGVEALSRRIGTRRVSCVAVFLSLLLVILGLGYFIFPAMARQATEFTGKAEENLSKLDEALVQMTESFPVLRQVIPERSARAILGEFLGIQPKAGHGLDDETWKVNLHRLFAVMGRTLSAVTSFLLALLFSFLVVLDLPNLARGIRSLRDSKLRFIYDEVSDTVFTFGQTLGKMLEAQLMIALCNTALTAIGLYFMGFPSLAFLSAVVFLCSFIPVAGVFISSVPICLTALTLSGVGLMLWAIVFITVIHMIEAYILNPRIVGAHLKINPVLVLAILVIGHDLVGLWGLILGVPVFSYIFGHAIHAHARPPAPEPGQGSP